MSRSRAVRFALRRVAFITTGVGMPEPPELFRGRRGSEFYACLRLGNHADQYQCFAMYRKTPMSMQRGSQGGGVFEHLPEGGVHTVEHLSSRGVHTRV